MKLFQSILIRNLSFELKPNDVDIPPFKTPNITQHNFLEIATSLEILQKKFPKLDFISPDFQQYALKLMEKSFLAIGQFTPVHPMIYHFPFLFDFNVRQLYVSHVALTLTIVQSQTNYFFLQIKQRLIPKIIL